MTSYPIELIDISKKIKKNNIINGVNLGIKEGEIFGLLGPNGAGKTTLMKMMVRLISPTSGKIVINGEQLSRENSSKLLSSVSAIIETPQLYPNLTGRENLEYFARMDNVSDYNKIEKIIDFVSIGKYIDNKFSTYSLGMKQRLGIGQALLKEPKLLILDEPINGLDPAGIIQLRQYLKELAHEQGITIIISSHILSEIEQTCDRIAIINKGNLVSIKDLSQDTDKHIYKLLAKPIDIVDKIIKSNYKLETTIEEEGITFETDSEQIPDIIDTLVKNQVSIYSIYKDLSSLEREFIELTKD